MELNLDWQARRSALWPEVSYELRPLRVWAFQELVAFWEAVPGGAATSRAATSPAATGGAATGSAAQAPRAEPPAASAAPATTSAASTARLMDVARRIFPEHVRNLAGLTARTEGGAVAVAVAELSEEAALLPLAAEIVAALIDLSTVGLGAEKN